MTTWTREAVLAASDAWRWVPEGAEALVVDGIDVIDYPDWALMGFYARPRRVPDPERIVAAVVKAARERGRAKVQWWVSPSTRLVDLADFLIAHGATLDVETEVYALDLTDGIPDHGPTEGLVARLVQDEATLDDAEHVTAAVWGGEPSSGERRAQKLAALARPAAEQDGFQVVVYDATGAPLATGGCQIVDRVARLWSACTLLEARGRGAYRLVLARRLEVAVEHGATLALVHASVGISGPIVRRIGFTPYGTGRILSQATGLD